MKVIQAGILVAAAATASAALIPSDFDKAFGDITGVGVDLEKLTGGGGGTFDGLIDDATKLKEDLKELEEKGGIDLSEALKGAGKLGDDIANTGGSLDKLKDELTGIIGDLVGIDTSLVDSFNGAFPDLGDLGGNLGGSGVNLDPSTLVVLENFADDIVKKTGGKVAKMDLSIMGMQFLSENPTLSAEKIVSLTMAVISKIDAGTTIEEIKALMESEVGASPQPNPNPPITGDNGGIDLDLTTITTLENFADEIVKKTGGKIKKMDLSLMGMQFLVANPTLSAEKIVALSAAVISKVDAETTIEEIRTLMQDEVKNPGQDNASGDYVDPEFVATLQEFGEKIVAITGGKVKLFELSNLGLEFLDDKKVSAETLLSISKGVLEKVGPDTTIEEIKALMESELSSDDSSDNSSDKSDDEIISQFSPEFQSKMSIFAKSLLSIAGPSISEEDLHKVIMSFVRKNGVDEHLVTKIVEAIVSSASRGITAVDVADQMSAYAKYIDENPKASTDEIIAGSNLDLNDGAFDDLDDIFDNLGGAFNDKDFQDALDEANKKDNTVLVAGLAAGGAFLVGAAAASLFVMRRGGFAQKQHLREADEQIAVRPDIENPMHTKGPSTHL